MNKNRIIEDYLQGKHPIEQESWEMPSADELERDEALFESLMAKKKAPKRIRLWPLAVAACVAGFVAIFLAPPREANVEPVEQPVVAQQVDKQEEPVVKEEPAETVTEAEVPVKPRKVPKRKPVVQQKPIEEPLLAEAEVVEKVPAEDVCHEAPKVADPFLAVADQIQDIRSRGGRLGREIAQITDNQIKYQ